MKQLIEQLLSKIADMGAAPCADCETGVAWMNDKAGGEFVVKYPHTSAAMTAVHEAADKLEAALEQASSTLGRVVTSGHIITATAESTGILINVSEADAECPLFVAEVLVEVFDGQAAIHIYYDADDAPTQTIRLN